MVCVCVCRERWFPREGDMERVGSKRCVVWCVCLRVCLCVTAYVCVCVYVCGCVCLCVSMVYLYSQEVPNDPCPLCLPSGHWLPSPPASHSPVPPGTAT